jgi:hypothetical protein
MLALAVFLLSTKQQGIMMQQKLKQLEEAQSQQN